MLAKYLRPIWGVVVALLLSAAVLADSPTLYAVDRDTNLLRAIDPTTGATLWSIPMTSAAGAITGANGLCRDPVSGDLWVVCRIGGGRWIGRVDPCTGNVTMSGNTGINFAGIACGNDGTLYGVSGDGASPSETLFTLDKATGAATVLLALGNGNDGEAIAFHPGNGLIYHASGLGIQVFESVDPVGLTVTNVGQSGQAHGEILSLCHWVGNNLLACDLASNLFVVSTAGHYAQAGSLGFACKGLAFGPSNWALLTVSPGDGNLRTLSPVDLAVIDTVAMATAGGTPITGCNGLARNPRTGELWVVFKTGGNARSLGRLNLDTGVVYPTGPLGDSVADITFDGTGTLWGVTGDGATVPETLYTIAPGGAMTLVTPLGNGDDGESICWNPNDGLIYHASGLGTQNLDEIFETYNPSGGAITSVPLSGDDYGEIRAMLHFAGDAFFVANFESRRVHLVSTTGVVQRLGQLDHDVKGIAFTSSTPFCLRTVSPFNNSLETVSRVNFATLAATPLVDSAAGTIAGCNGMDRDLTTGQTYLLARVGSSRDLGRIDFRTATVTRIGPTGDNFAGLAFDRFGALFGVTGDGAATPESLYRINKNNAATALIAALGNGDDGESIAWGHGTGQIYHCSGLGVPNDPIGGEVFEQVDPGTGVATPITLSGYDYDEMFSMTPTLRNGFLCSDINSSVVFLNTRGVSSRIGALSRHVRGITFDPAPRTGFGQTRGTGCAAVAGSGRTPVMLTAGCPNFGGTVNVITMNAPAASALFLLFGHTPGFNPLGPIAYPGCAIQMNAIVASLFFFTNGSGQHTLAVPIPTSLSPGDFLFQSALLDGPLFSLSNPVRVHIQ